MQDTTSLKARETTTKMRITKTQLRSIIREEISKLTEEDDWMQKAFAKNKGSLKKKLGVPEDKDISVSKMADALRQGGDIEQKARAAVNANPDKYGSIKHVGVDKKPKSPRKKKK